VFQNQIIRYYIVFLIAQKQTQLKVGLINSNIILDYQMGGELSEYINENSEFEFEDEYSAAVRMQRLLRRKFECISGKTWEEKLATCNSCKCCQRHTTNRPKKLEPWIETRFSIYDHFGECICPCRHNARFICRQVSEPASECPLGSPRFVDLFTDVLTPGEKSAWTNHLNTRNNEDDISTLTISES